MTFPTLFSVIHQEFIGFQENDDGNSVRTYANPVTQPVYCFGPHTARNWTGAETRTGTTYLETVDQDLLMPKVPVGLKDRFILSEDGQDVTYEVVDVGDWTHGFHAWPAGIVVALTKWQG